MRDAWTGELASIGCQEGVETQLLTQALLSLDPGSKMEF